MGHLLTCLLIYPCMVYLGTFGCLFLVNVGKYTRHGSYGIGLGFNAIKTMLDKAKIGLGSPQEKK